MTIDLKPTSIQQWFCGCLLTTQLSAVVESALAGGMVLAKSGRGRKKFSHATLIPHLQSQHTKIPRWPT